MEAKIAANSAMESNTELLMRIAVKKDKHTLGWNRSNEFLHNGIMYDVVSSNVSKDSIVFLCFQDNYESWIKREVDRYLNIFFGKSGHKKKPNFYSKYGSKKLIQPINIGLEKIFLLKYYRFCIDFIFHYQLMITNTPFVPPEFKF
ncbi:hypothetical protein MYP_716 [Sporocytophaga myxococcoides]|uniref:Uncharacterized protein n=1 Tax=Sporocytophaga myxococcoides TaxID=153721 RepID=A0A098LAL7_9BACT|nr:hypothetical protein MYP_716 [Sporocytophaga myxococcoides]